MNTAISSVRARTKSSQPFRVVLHQLNGEWWTHLENVLETKAGYSSKEPADFYWGRKFGQDYIGAAADYNARCAKYELR